MGDNRQPTIRIGAKVNGVVKGKVTNKGKVNIETDGKSNFDVGHEITGDVEETAHVINETTYEQKVAMQQKQEELKLNDSPKEEEVPTETQPKKEELKLKDYQMDVESNDGHL